MTPGNPVTGLIEIKIPMRPSEMMKWCESVCSGTVWQDDHMDELWMCCGGSFTDGETPILKFIRFQRPPGTFFWMDLSGRWKSDKCYRLRPMRDLIFGDRPTAIRTGLTQCQLNNCPWTELGF